MSKLEKLDIEICFHLCSYISQTIGSCYTSSRVFGVGAEKRGKVKVFFLSNKSFKKFLSQMCAKQGD